MKIPHHRVCAVLGAALALFLFACASVAADPQSFGIFTSTLDGSNVRRVLSDPDREMNHARVSPDKNWITFTRYNKRGLFGGDAKEDNGYEESEIMLVRADGTNLQSLVPSRKGMVAANGYWTEDGSAILYVSNDNSQKRAQISRIDVASRKISKVPLEGDLWASDPHLVGDKLAVSVLNEEKKNMSIWITDSSGRKSRQITFPSGTGIDPATKTPLGDFDPKISPDGSKLVAMRNMGGHNWHAVVIDLKTGQERDISPDKSVDGVPEWSSDSRKLIFWYADTKELMNSGLYTMNPDGSNRQRIPLPRGFFYTMPAFFPGEGSGPSARIIFSGHKNSRL